MDVVVGRVAKAHGITGELAVDVRTDSPEARFAKGSVLAARLRERVPNLGELVVNQVGAVIGAHVGPGMLAVVIAPR